MLPPGRNVPPRSETATERWVAIVDDHTSMRTSLARAFRLEGIRAAAFASAADYLAHSTSSAPVCLVLDVQLPRMSGPELARQLARERPPLPPTIFISGHEELLQALDGDPLAYGLLRKPFDMSELLRLVRPLLGR
jgi:FixJ family two-component response regulator